MTWIVQVALVLTLACVLGCSGSPGVKDTPLALQPKVSAMTTAMLVEKYADLMPENLIGLGVFDLKTLGEEGTKVLLTPSGYPEQIANAQAFGRELSALYVETFGLDLGQVDTAIMVLGADVFFWIVEGPLPDPKHLSPIVWNGHEIVEIKGTDGGEGNMWAKLDRRRSAMTIYQSQEDLELFHHPERPLSKNEAGYRHFLTLGAAPLGLLTLIARTEGPIFDQLREELDPTGFGLPESMRVSFDPEAGLRVGLWGRPEALQELKAAVVTAYNTMMANETQKRLEAMEGSPFLKRFTGLLSHHGTLAYQAYLTHPEVTKDGTLFYDFPPDAVQGVLLGAFISGALQGYAEEDEVTEAPEVLGDLAARVKAAYQAGTLGACTFPPSSTPSAPAPPADGARVPVLLDATWDPYKGSTLHALPQASFSYEIESQGSRVILLARADFVPGGELHTESVVVEAVADNFSCRANVVPQVTRFEGE